MSLCGGLYKWVEGDVMKGNKVFWGGFVRRVSSMGVAGRGESERQDVFVGVNLRSKWCVTSQFVEGRPRSMDGRKYGKVGVFLLVSYRSRHRGPPDPPFPEWWVGWANRTVGIIPGIRFSG